MLRRSAALAAALIVLTASPSIAKSAHHHKTKASKQMSVPATKAHPSVALARRRSVRIDALVRRARAETAALRRENAALRHLLAPKPLLEARRMAPPPKPTSFAEAPFAVVTMASLHLPSLPLPQLPDVPKAILGVIRAPLRALAGFPAQLVRKVEEIVTGCGSRVSSAYRPGAVVAGTNRPSLHRYRRAVDLVGSPKCAYAHLRGWPGGYSVDYSKVQHIHVSYSPHGREWGARFSHHHVGKTRHAKRSRSRQA